MTRQQTERPHRFVRLGDPARREAALQFERWVAGRATRTALPRWLAALRRWRGRAAPDRLGEVLDAFVGSLGFRAPAVPWSEVDEAAARAAFDRVIGGSLAYGGRIPREESDRAAHAWFDLLPMPRRFFLASDLTGATFDEGLGVVAGEAVGFVWQIAED